MNFIKVLGYCLIVTSTFFLWVLPIMLFSILYNLLFQTGQLGVDTTPEGYVSFLFRSILGFSLLTGGIISILYKSNNSHPSFFDKMKKKLTRRYKAKGSDGSKAIVEEHDVDYVPKDDVENHFG